MILKVINYLDTIPPLIILLFPKTNKGLRGSFIYWFLVIQLVFNLTSNIIDELDGNNHYLYHANCFLSFITLSLYYKKSFNSTRSARNIFVVGILFSVFFFLNIFVWENIGVFNSNSFGAASFIFCSYSLFYYLSLLREPGKTNVAYSKNFWLNTGIFTYYTANFFIFLTFNRLTEKELPLLALIWRIHNLIFLIMCIYIFIGALCRESQAK
jgi:hypothetical protein